MNGKVPLYLTLLSLALFGAAILVFQPYSADWPGSGYAKPAHRYIRAALRQDSIGLARLSASPGAVTWALHVARRRPDSLASWAARTEALLGERRGDTADVFLYPAVDPCSDQPIVLRFVGSGERARVLEASSTCLDGR
jgi:hypothetical protein